MHLYMLILVGFLCKIVTSAHGYEQDEVLHDYTVHQYYQPLYYPTNTLTFINCVVIKNTLKI